ncbi:hypothetical protein JOD43_002068 [Pullulanibacillus pueri]|uniref:hypothetical protein n=1 Tax=Pullulanibacillus pueri TaxID=1437324 RepID=UPI0019593405|nr:hypothetical protein [Pullulanibacillus pueri]MBM7681896.1 hypothetical protein [Pullulanibacillus pueri]
MAAFKKWCSSNGICQLSKGVLWRTKKRSSFQNEWRAAQEKLATIKTKGKAGVSINAPTAKRRTKKRFGLPFGKKLFHYLDGNRALLPGFFKRKESISRRSNKEIGSKICLL